MILIPQIRTNEKEFHNDNPMYNKMKVFVCKKKFDSVNANCFVLISIYIFTFNNNPSRRNILNLNKADNNTNNNLM